MNIQTRARTWATSPLGLFLCGDCQVGGDDDGSDDGGGTPIFFLPLNLGGICAGWGCYTFVPPGTVPRILVQTTVDVSATPCDTTATTGQRVTAGIQGALNLGLGEAKTLAYATLGVAGVAGTPETGGVSLLATAAAGYGIFTSQAQVASGAAQLYTAFSGDLQGGQGMQQVGDIMAGPVLGVPTLVATQNGATAQRAANYESVVTAGSGLVNSKGFGEAVQGAVDFGLSAMGLAGDDGCN